MNKRLSLLLVNLVCLIVVSTSISTAAPVSHSNLGREYLVGTQNLGKWCAGFYYQSQERDITLSRTGRGIQSMDANKYLGHIGYDILPWLTPYVIFGSAVTTISGSYEPSPEAEYGLGFMFNILDTEIEDPTLIEDRLRLNAHIQYTKGSTTYGGRAEMDWNDFSGALTLSLVNDFEGDKFFVPNSIAIFAGPIFSLIDSNDLETETDFGYIAGVDLFFSEKISFEVAYSKYDKGAVSFGVNVRF